MSDNLRAYTRALYGLDHVVRLAPADGWGRMSPCEGWTAGHVLGHVIAIQRYFESIITGAPVTTDPFAADTSVFAGEDPAQAWSDTREALLEVLDHDGVLHCEVEAFGRPNTVDGMIGFNVGDLTIHSWDLARTFGVDERLEPMNVARVLATLEPMGDAMRRPGIFGSRVEVADDADPQARLLAFTGRRP
ncbi:MAG: TIGR03086 family metal-binding protein [Ilumatobacteraceae bacterium]